MTTPAPMLILSNIIIDDVRLPDGTRYPHLLGGAAVHAAVGAAFWWPRVGIVAGVGRDFDSVTAGKLAAFGLHTEGHLVRDDRTIHSTLVYRADGERTETPVHGVDHFRRMQATAADIPDPLLPAACTYIFRDVWPTFWRAYGRYREGLGTVLWELQGDAAERRYWPAIRHVLPMVDIFSLNSHEGDRLLGLSDPDAVVRRLIAAGAGIVVLRRGSEGAIIADRTGHLRLRPPPAPTVDVTGGGNAFCGGFLGGWCLRPADLEHAGRCAAASAARAIAQYGPPDPRERDGLAALAAATAIERHSWGMRGALSE